MSSYAPLPVLPTGPGPEHVRPYGDLVQFNASRQVLDAVGREVLAAMAEDYLELLGTSSAVYETNGEYAMGIFTSGWCRFMDAASYRLCGTDDPREALASGRWHCHESCWNASRDAMRSGGEADVACEGGIRLHAVPIVAAGEVVGSINFGYGDPPREPERLAELAERYQVSVEELEEQAAAYVTRPPEVVEMAKRRLRASAKLIGEIVARKRAEETLRESERRFRLMADAVPQIVWITDAEGKAEFFNQQWTDYTGQPFAPTMAAEIAATAVHPEDSVDTLERFEEARRTGGTFLVEHRIRSASGEYRWFLVRGEPYRSPENGEIERWFGASVDIHDRKLAEEALRQAKEIAEQASRSKSEFLAVMSHELRTPLNAIAGYVDLIELGIHGPVTEAQRKALGRVQKSQQHLLGLINEVLNYARLESGAVTYEITDVSLRELLTTTEALVEPQAQARRLVLGVTECDPSVTVRADPEKLRQVLLNLLSNAVKFTDPGGRIEIDCETAGDWLELRVRDTGIGIPADRLESVFEPFVQVHADLTRTAEGTGLGLAISRDLTRGMGGDLTVESTPGEGSVFTVRLRRSAMERVTDEP